MIPSSASGCCRLTSPAYAGHRGDHAVSYTTPRDTIPSTAPAPFRRGLEETAVRWGTRRQRVTTDDAGFEGPRGPGVEQGNSGGQSVIDCRRVKGWALPRCAASPAAHGLCAFNRTASAAKPSRLPDGELTLMLSGPRSTGSCLSASPYLRARFASCEPARLMAVPRSRIAERTTCTLQ